MGWLRFAGSLKLYISLENICLFCRALLQKRPVILRSLLVVATPYQETDQTFKKKPVGLPKKNVLDYSKKTYLITQEKLLEPPKDMNWMTQKRCTGLLKKNYWTNQERCSGLPKKDLFDYQRKTTGLTKREVLNFCSTKEDLLERNP